MKSATSAFIFHKKITFQKKLIVNIGFYLEVYIPHIFEVREIIPFKNGFSSSNHVLNYKTEKKLHYTLGDSKFTKLLLILTFRLTFKLLHI